MLITLNITQVYSQGQWEQTTIPNVANSYIVDVDFINSNTGFIALKVHAEIDTMIIYKTTDKGLSFSKFWSTINYDSEFGMTFNNADTGFVFYGDDVYKIWENYNQSLAINNSWVPSKHIVKIFENGIGYCLYGTKQSTNYYCYSRIYKTTNFGISWSIVFEGVHDGSSIILSDVDVLKSNPDSVIVVGQIKGLDGLHPQSRSGIRITSSDGFSTAHFNSISNVNDSIAFDFVNFLPNGESRILANDGIYNQSLTKIYNITEAGYFTTQYGFRFINNSLGLAALNSGEIIQTTNGGYNWNVVSSIGYGGQISSQISSIGDIAYYGDATSRTLFTRKLNTDLKTYFDNQSTSSSIFFDGTQYNSPSTQYLRGGNSIVYSPLAQIINPNQSNESQFYSWSNGNMNYNNHDFYFDQSGTTIANYYKTKQLSTTSGAISSIGQTKTLKDEWGAINQIHQSLDGGIIYTKSYDNGGSYKREEIVNATTTHSVADGNKNPAICETRWYGTLGGGYPVNKNVSACWERYNPSNDTTEIKVAVRSYDINSDTSFKWNNWEDGNNSDVFASFSSSAGYNSFPKIFASALDPNNYLGEPSTYFLRFLT